MKQSRTYLTKRNARASLVNRVITLICNFCSRSVFIRILGNEYLGAGGMFGNVFSVLSLCELGFGEAVSQSLYQPLARGETGNIRAILAYYTKVYRGISLVMLTLSLAFMPFLPYFFADIEKIHRYRAVYLLFCVHQVLSYYFAPKRALVQCDQRMYAVMTIRTISSVCVTAAQIFFLYLTGNYLIYIFLRIFFSAVDGFLVNLYADHTYPYLCEMGAKKVGVGVPYKAAVWKNTRALVLHRIGGVINSSTDSILISSHLGLAHMGVFSNYSLIINSVGSFVSLAIQAASASVGNLGATENEEKSIRVLRELCFANFVLMTNCAALLTSLVTPFIALWIGADKCFSMTETAVIIACFYMSYIRDPVQIFIHSFGVFRSTGFLYLVRGLLNLALSLLFVHRYGAVGVFAGTLLSTVLTAFLFEPYCLFAGAFHQKASAFVREYFCYPPVTAAICAVSYFAGSRMDSSTFTGMVLRGTVVLLTANLMILALYGRSERFRSFRRLLLRGSQVGRKTARTAGAN